MKQKPVRLLVVAGWLKIQQWTQTVITVDFALKITIRELAVRTGCSQARYQAKSADIQNQFCSNGGAEMERRWIGKNKLCWSWTVS